MRNQSKKLFLFVVLAGFLRVAPGFGAPCTTTVTPVDDLQTAINDATAGDVLCLAPGVYEPSIVVEVNKALTLQGPQAGVDPRFVAGSLRGAADETSEAIIDGDDGELSIIVRINADDVTLDGLVIRNGTGDLVYLDAGAATTNPTIRYCLIHNSSGDEGLQLRAAINPVVENNRIYGTGGDAVNICCGSSGATIQYNEIYSVSSTRGAIYTYENGAGGATFSITDNVIYDVWNNDAIKLGIHSGGDTADPGGLVARNVISNVAQDGIAVYTSNVRIQANEIFESFSINGAIYVTYDADLVAIEDNFVHDNGSAGAAVTYAVRVGAASYHPTNVTVSGNCFENNEGGVIFNYDSGPLLAAEDNWWGDASGPSGVGPGTGDSASAFVDFDPWLGAESNCAPDADGDGDPDQTDCQPDDPDIHHGADELCDDEDRNCDGDAYSGASDATTWYLDGDGDGFGEGLESRVRCVAPDGFVDNMGDCDDSDPGINPGETELCDDADRDCDGESILGAIDMTTFYRDSDLDGFGNADESLDACVQPAGYVLDTNDCDDGERLSFPGAAELCDEKDNDCDGDTDEKDADGDGFLDEDCGGEDCDDADHHVHPDAQEACFDGIDNDCDGDLDAADADCACEEHTYYRDRDGDGWGDEDKSEDACEPPFGFTEAAGDCDDKDPGINPQAPENCFDGVDNDCDGKVDDESPHCDSDCESHLLYRDEDRDGWGDPENTASACGSPAGYVELAGDCDDGEPGINPGEPERCDGHDTNCDGEVDNKDADEDGFLDAECGGDDCEDRDYRSHPEAAEICFDGVDNDCDGETDENNSSCKDSGCGCAAAGTSSGFGWPLPALAGLTLLLALALRRDRRDQ